MRTVVERDGRRSNVFELPYNNAIDSVRFCACLVTPLQRGQFWGVTPPHAIGSGTWCIIGITGKFLVAGEHVAVHLGSP